MKKQNIWIGLAQVEPRSGNELLDGGVGAFVPVVALADDENEFASLATTLLEMYDFNVIIVEDIVLLETRRRHYEVDSKVVELAANLSPENPAALSDFEVYES